MRQLLLAIPLTLLVALASTATAQTTPRAIGVSLSGGLAQPVGEFSHVVNTGFQLGAALWLRPNSRLAWRADATYDRLGIDLGPLGEQYRVTSHMRILGGSASAIYRLSANTQRAVRPYVLGGLGVYEMKVSISSPEGSSASPGATRTAVHAGAGADLRLSGFNTFVELRFQNIFNGDDGREIGRENSRYLPLVFGVRF